MKYIFISFNNLFLEHLTVKLCVEILDMGENRKHEDNQCKRKVKN